MADAAASPEIVVIAGVNGAGKSSIIGAALEARGGWYYNADRATSRYLAAGLALEQANIRAWQRGRVQLETAIRTRRDYAFETTLGGRTITTLLMDAATSGHVLRMSCIGLNDVTKHLARIASRVRAGGHAIEERRVRTRFDDSRRNLIRLLPHLSELVLYDNSRDADPKAGKRPEPHRLMHILNGEVMVAPPERMPTWAKPIIAAALT